MHNILSLSLLRAIKPRCQRRIFLNYFSRSSSSDSKSFDPYEVLGVEPGSSFDEIRKQYMKLSKQYHPDYNQGNEQAKVKFITITKAYKALVEKVEKGRGPSGSSSSESIKSDYDFTVEPLGIETDAPKPVSVSKALMTSMIICIVAVVAIHFLKDAVGSITTTVKERVSKKTAREQEKELIEETRLAIIEYHRRKEILRELYEKASSR